MRSFCQRFRAWLNGSSPEEEEPRQRAVRNLGGRDRAGVLRPCGLQTPAVENPSPGPCDHLPPNGGAVAAARRTARPASRACRRRRWRPVAERRVERLGPLVPQQFAVRVVEGALVPLVRCRVMNSSTQLRSRRPSPPARWHGQCTSQEGLLLMISTSRGSSRARRPAVPAVGTAILSSPRRSGSRAVGTAECGRLSV